MGTDFDLRWGKQQDGASTLLKLAIGTSFC